MHSSKNTNDNIMKAGVTMHRRSHMELSSMIVFLSIISIFIQYTAYYFLDPAYLVLGIGGLIVVICTHVLLERSLTYESCFIYTLLILFISILITLLTYRGDFLPTTNSLYGIIIINWFMPTLYCFVHSMLDGGSRHENFNSFYRNVSIIFVLIYLGILVYGNFYQDAFPWAYPMASKQLNFTPFWSIATQIEDYINDLIPLSDILTYLFVRTLTYVPYGYYIILILRKTPKLVKFIALLFLPSIIELIQYFQIPTRFDIDDVVYAFIGGIIGAGLFYLTNGIYRFISGRNFLSSESDYRYNSGSIYY